MFFAIVFTEQAIGTIQNDPKACVFGVFLFCSTPAKELRAKSNLHHLLISWPYFSACFANELHIHPSLSAHGPELNRASVSLSVNS